MEPANSTEHLVVPLHQIARNTRRQVQQMNSVAKHPELRTRRELVAGEIGASFGKECLDAFEVIGGLTRFALGVDLVVELLVE